MTRHPQEILNEYIRPQDTVITAVSGGPDSVCLLNECLRFAKKIPFKIVVAHVNHRLRGRDSDGDAEFVQQLAKKNNLIFELKNLKKITKGNLEEECRNRRYAFFEDLRKKYRARWILTAHHLNDNIETVLFNLVRGSFFGGMKGMEMASEKRHLLRPLLHFTRTEIMREMKKLRLKYRIDKSNNDTSLARNLIRRNVIPLLKKINSNFEKTFTGNIGNFNETATYMETVAEKWLQQNSIKDAVPLENFLKLPRILQQVVISQIYKKTYGNTVKFNGPHLRQILAMLQRRKAGLKKEFGDANFLLVTRQPQKKERFITIQRK